MTVSGSDLGVEIRPGTEEDIPLLHSFMRMLAEFEKLEFAATAESLRDALFSEQPAANSLLAFVDGKPAGYATYFFTFASSVGRRGLWLDDVFVHPDFRGRGIGRALMNYVADVAVRHKCVRYEWMVLDWNASAIAFYESLGASILPDWRICRIEYANISSAEESHPEQ